MLISRMLFISTRRQILMLLALCAPAAFGHEVHTSIEGLKAALLVHLQGSEAATCAAKLAKSAIEKLPFKMVVGVETKGKVDPLARRNLGPQVLDQLNWFWSGGNDELKPFARIEAIKAYRRNSQPRTYDEVKKNDAVNMLAQQLETDGVSFESPPGALRVTVGFELFLVPPPEKGPLREHLVLVKTFPHERLAGVLLDSLVLELGLIPSEDILVLHADITGPKDAKTEIQWSATDRGNLGTRALADGLGMPRPSRTIFAPDHQIVHYPFPVLRLRVGRPAEEGHDLLAEYLDAPAEPRLRENQVHDSLDLVQRWLVDGFYRRNLPMRAVNNTPAREDTYFGAAGRHPYGHR